MSNETKIRQLIMSSIQRAVQESIGAALVLVLFAIALSQSEAGSARYFGCLIIMVGTGFITGVVWSHALSFGMLRSHSPNDLVFWREAFAAQARLLRLAPLWFCAPICSGGLLFAAPAERWELIPFMVVALILAVVFAWLTKVNRAAADQLDQMGSQLKLEN